MSRRLVQSMIATAIALSPATLLAESFWADRLGGGAADVLARQTIGKKYVINSANNIIFSNESGQYVVRNHTKGSISLPHPISAVYAGSSHIPADVELDGGNTVELDAGDWTIDVGQRKQSSNSEAPALDEGYVSYEDSRYSLSVSQIEEATPSGSRIGLSARILDQDGAVLINQVDGIKMKATVYQGTKAYNNKLMKDDGNSSSGDAFSGDGVYSASIPINKDGDFTVMVSFSGGIDGSLIELSTAVKSFVSGNRVQVSNQTISSTLGDVNGEPLEEARYGLPITVRALKGAVPDIVESYAEVWAKDGNDQDVVVGWTGGLVKPKKQGKLWSIPFTFHSGWLAEGDFYPPVTLKNIELKDIDVGDEILVDNPTIEVSGISKVGGGASNGRRSLKSSDTESEMHRGVHPNNLGLNPTARAGSRWGSGRVVLSLHGFCDGGKSLDGFNSTIRNKGLVYTGSGSGQSATRYATDVMAYLNYNPGKIRGIVAHSHGGMAAASLLQHYSYIFTDNASSRPPNVVSMGTPYHGSGLLEGRLPGWISTGLISLFQNQTGCTIPNELYPSRNASWNNSIKWRARYQMAAFFTTHTKPKTFENRDCRDSLSAQILGSDDGVLAPSNGLGFVDGGDYDLHYSGYCHVPGLGQGDQWQNPTFKNFVNNLFFSATESYQPF